MGSVRERTGRCRQARAAGRFARRPGRRARTLLCGLALGLGLAGCAPHRADSTAEQLVEQGWDAFRLGEFVPALRAFQDAQARAPHGSALRLQALYGTAVTWDLRRPGEDPRQAAALYRAVIAAAPTNDLAAWSWLALARMKGDICILIRPPMRPPRGRPSSERASFWAASTPWLPATPLAYLNASFQLIANSSFWPLWQRYWRWSASQNTR